MNREINLLKNNQKREWDDLEWVQEFYEFLKGSNPDNISPEDGKPLIKLSPNKAYNIIWYLQEHFSILPDTIEQCSICKELYDSGRSGHHSELTGKFYCSSNCEPNNLYEKEQRHEEKLLRKLNQSYK